MRLLLALLLAPALAHADPQRAVVGHGYALVIDRGLAVEKGKIRAHLDDTAAAIGTVTVDVTKDKLGADVEDRCGVRRHLTWTYAELDSALARAAAFQGGDVTALAPYLKTDPVASYVQLAIDPKLAPLLDKPALRALRSARAGTATVTAETITGDVVYAPDRKLLAVVRSERSWGGPVILVRNVEIYDLKGKLVASAPLAKPTAATIQALLRDLGFSPITVEPGAGKVPKAAVSDHLQAALYVPELRAVVIWTVRPGAEGCEDTDPTRVLVISG